MNQFIEFTKEYLKEHKDFHYIYYVDTGVEWSGNWKSEESRRNQSINEDEIK